MRKKFRLLIITLVLILGLGFTGSAGAVSFDIDFGQDGIMETGGDWTLIPCTTVLVDLWVNEVPAPGLVGFGFGFGVQPGAEINFEILNYDIVTGSDSFLQSKIFDGGFYAESLFPPGTFLDGTFKMVTFELHCTAPSIDELWIYDYKPLSTQWLLADGTILDNQILPQQLATLTQTPVPAAVWLLASGIIGIAGLKRRKKA